MKNFLRAALMMALVSGVVGVAGISANADPLLPGTAIGGPTTALFVGAGQTLLASNNLAVVNASMNGFARVAVVRNTGGTIDFYYQFTNTGGNAPPSTNDSITRLAGFNFTGFTTDVNQILNGSALAVFGAAGFVDGSVLSLTTDRNASGATVGWNYTTAGQPASLLDPGFSSVTFRISTNAVAFTGGNFAIADGVVANSPGYQPTIPEPASVLLLGTGLVGAAGAFRRRFKKTSSN